MPEFIQIKISDRSSHKATSPTLKQRLNAYNIRVQKKDSERQYEDEIKVVVGDGFKKEAVYIPPCILITITGERLATKKNILQILRNMGIEIIKSGRITQC